MADTAADQTAAPAPAAGELQIPKYRLDEVSNELRRAREELQIKDRLILETQQRMNQNQPRGPELPTAEELGLDPTTYKAVTKIAEKIVESTVGPQRAQLEQQVGALYSQIEKTNLLASQGAQTEKYLPEIEKRQMEHFRMTGSHMPAKMVLKLIQADESDKRIRDLEAKIAALTGGQATPQATTQTTQDAPTTGPGATGTREIPTAGSAGGSGGSQSKNFSEMTVEEMERRLEEQFGQGVRL